MLKALTTRSLYASYGAQAEAQVCMTLEISALNAVRTAHPSRRIWFCIFQYEVACVVAWRGPTGSFANDLGWSISSHETPGPAHWEVAGVTIRGRPALNIYKYLLLTSNYPYS